MAVRRADEAREWATVCDYMGLLLELPGPSSAREETLLDLIAGLVDRAKSAQTEIENRRGPRQWPVPDLELNQFRALLAILGTSAQSPAHYDIPKLVLPRVLAIAEWPILDAFDPETFVLLLPELSELHAHSRRHPLTGRARDWLRQMITRDGTDEEYSATEEEEP